MKKNNKKKKIIALLLSLLMIFGNTISVFAATLSITNTGATYSYDAYGNGAGNNMHGVFVANDSSYGTVFCGEHDRMPPVAFGNTKKLSIETFNSYDPLRKVLYYGWGGPAQWSGFSSATYNSVYQLFSGNVATSKAQACGIAVTSTALSEAYSDIGGNGSVWTVSGLPEFKAYVASKPNPPGGFVVYRLPGGSNQDLFTWKYNPTGTLNLSKSSTDSTGVVAAFPSSFSLAGAKYGVYTRANATGRVGTLTTNAAGASNNLTLDAGTYYVKEITAPKGYKLDSNVYTAVVPSGGTKTLYVSDIPYAGWGKVSKSADNSSGIVTSFPAKYGLAGAKYGIYSSRANAQNNSAAITTLTTDSGGNTTSVVLPVGTYYVKETVAPANYELDSSIYTLNITDGNTTTVTVTEKPKFGYAKLKKTVEKDDHLTALCPENYTLEGAEYEVYDDATGAKVGTLVTDSNGDTGTIKLPEGKYYAKEVKAPKGFNLNVNETNTVTITNGSTGVFNHSDKPKFDPLSITVEKKLAPGVDPRFTPEGAEYKVRYYKEFLTKDEVEGKTPFKTWVIKIKKDNKGRYGAQLSDRYLVTEKSDPLLKDEDGAVVGLWGTYVVTEEYAPLGLARTEGIISCQQSTFDHELQKVNIVKDVTDLEKAQTVSITINKVDAETGLATAQGHGTLAGAKFEVFHYDELRGKNVTDGYITTDTDGKGTLPNLKPGVYKVKEIKAPNGYVKNTEIKTIEAGLREHNTANFDYVYKCEEKVTLTKIIKYANGLLSPKVKGAKMQVLDNLGNIMDEFTTTDDNFIIKGLKVGDYTLHEVTAPEGYVKAADVAFEIKQDTEKTEVKMLDLRVSAEKTEGIFDRPLAGAKLAVEDTSGNIVDAWTTTTDKHYISGLEYGKTYFLKEVQTPAGYVTAKPIKFTVTGTDDIHLQMEDIRVSAVKTDIETNEALAGAELVVKDEANNIIDSWTTTTDKHYISGLEYGSTYTLHEVAAPAGYVKAADISFTVTGNDEIELTMKDDFTKLQIKKEDANGNYVEGAKLQIINSVNTVVKEWTTTTDSIQFDRLPQGDYTLREIETPDGYVTAADVTFTLADTADIQKVTMEDIRVEANKVDANGDALKGAELTVKDNADNVVDSWTTDENKHYISGLKYGKTYKLYETKTPRGYVTAEPIEFTVTGANDMNITMKDLQVIIEKTDIENGRAIRNAELEVRDNGGNIVDAWTSNGTKRFVQNLKYGKTYKLYETKAPDGYVKITPIEFTVTGAKNININAQDDFIKVEISKKMLTGDDELPGATLQIIDENGNIIDEWVSTGTPHRIDRMTVGNYILKEIRPADGFVTAENVKFTVTETGEIQNVEMRDDVTKTLISKVDIKTGASVVGAELSIYPMGEDGKAIEGECFATWITSDTPHYVECLTIGKYILREKLQGAADLGYVTAADVEFEVKDTPDLQKVEMKDDYTKTEFVKEDVNGNPVVGATMSIIPLDEEGKPKYGETFATWVTEADNTETVNVDESIKYFEYLPIGRYLLIENSAPEGFVKADPIEFEVKDTSEVQKYVMTDTRVSAVKVDTEGNTVKNVELTVYDKDGNEVDKWVTEGVKNEKHYVSGLVENTEYTLKETKVPEGYVKANDVKFSTSSTENKEDVKVVMTDIRVSVEKVDKLNQKPLREANLVIKDIEGNEVDKWTTEDGKHFISGLEEGKTYILEETKAPKGYNVAEPIKFKVNTDKKDIAIKMVDNEKIGKIIFEYDDGSKSSTNKVDAESLIPTTGDFNGFIKYFGLLLVAMSLLLSLRAFKKKGGK